MTRVTQVAAALVRGWTSVYTLGLSREDRARRRQEIESDLWHSLNDPDRRGLAVALVMLTRLVAGIPDDIGWRVERPRPARPLVFAFAFAAVCMAMIIGLIAWAGTASTLPRPEPIVHFQPAPPPPPPPPPPPSVPR
jgi:hypothetical protein